MRSTFTTIAKRNPPVLHRKEAFLAPTHPLFAKFARLARQEEGHGLLDDTSTIGTTPAGRLGSPSGALELRGHRLVRRKFGKA